MPSEPPDNPATEEDALLVEAVTLLVRRQRETEAWVAEQLCLADERAVATEQRYADLETRLSGIEDQLTRLVRLFEPARGDRTMDERVARLRDELEGLKSEVDGRPAPPIKDADAVPVRSAAFSEPSRECSEPSPAFSEPSPALSEPSAALSEPSPDFSEPSVALSEPSPALSEPSPDISEPSVGLSEPPDLASNESSARGAETLEGPPAAALAHPAASAEVAPWSPPVEARAGSSSATLPADSRRYLASIGALLGRSTQQRFGLLMIAAGMLAVVYAILYQFHLV